MLGLLPEIHAPDFLADYVPTQWFRLLLGLWTLGLLWGSHIIWRVPVLMLLASILGLEVAAYFAVRLYVSAVEALFSSRLFSRERLERHMSKARSFKEYARWASELDRVEGRSEWKERTGGEHAYHPAVLRTATMKARAAREKGDALALMEILRPSLSRNFGGHLNWEMYSKTYVGTKAVIEEFTDEMERGLEWIAEAVGKGESADKLTLYADFVHDSATAFGTSCLFLSGGATLGFYHFGILRPLLAEGMLPNMVCGTSMGSIALSFLAVRTDEEAYRELESLKDIYQQLGEEGGPLQGNHFTRLWSLLTKGRMYDHKHTMKHLSWFTKGDTTFAEAFAHTGRLVNITCTPEKTRASRKMPPLLLNHIYSPNVTIASAVMASSCVPGMIPLVTLQEKVDGKLKPWRDMMWDQEAVDEKPRNRRQARKCGRRSNSPEVLPEDTLAEVQMRDGSFESDVPIETTRALFNTQYSIVSQTNPHVIPFFYNGTGSAGQPIRWPWRNFRGGWLVYLIELWIKEDMIKIFNIFEKMGLLFNVFGVDWNMLYKDRDYGETTIVPNATVLDYLRILTNEVSFENLNRKVRHSERNVWRHMSQISARMRLQRALRNVGEAVMAAAEDPATAPLVRDTVLRRCAPVHAAAFRVRGVVRPRSPSALSATGSATLGSPSPTGSATLGEFS